MINDYVGITKHAFLPKHKCINKNKTKVGIEHAESSKIREALDKIYIQKNDISNLEIKDLYYYNLIGDEGSRKLREKVTENLGIGLCNGKTLLKKDSFLINFARGGIVNEENLYQALQSKTIAGALIDVFEKEPDLR